MGCRFHLWQGWEATLGLPRAVGTEVHAPEQHERFGAQLPAPALDRKVPEQRVLRQHQPMAPGQGSNIC
eukprot:gene333-biopygen2468